MWTPALKSTRLPPAVSPRRAILRPGSTNRQNFRRLGIERPLLLLNRMGLRPAFVLPGASPTRPESQFAWQAQPRVDLRIAAEIRRPVFRLSARCGFLVSRPKEARGQVEAGLGPRETIQAPCRRSFRTANMPAGSAERGAADGAGPEGSTSVSGGIAGTAGRNSRWAIASSERTGNRDDQQGDAAERKGRVGGLAGGVLDVKPRDREQRNRRPWKRERPEAGGEPCPPKRR